MCVNLDTVKENWLQSLEILIYIKVCTSGCGCHRFVRRVLALAPRVTVRVRPEGRVRPLALGKTVLGPDFVGERFVLDD